MPCLSLERLRNLTCTVMCTCSEVLKSKKISNDQELIQSDPTSLERLRNLTCTVTCTCSEVLKSKKISNDQELIQSDPESC